MYGEHDVQLWEGDRLPQMHSPALLYRANKDVCGYRTGLHRNRFRVRRSGKLARSMKPSAPLQGRLGELQRETSAKLIDIASLIGVVGSSKLLRTLFLSSKPAPEITTSAAEMKKAAGSAHLLRPLFSREN
ncbi:hypothetical protein ACIPUD_15200 [Bradyrhizobium sp. CAR08]